MKKLVVRLVIVLVICVVVVAVAISMSIGSIIKKGVETVGPALTKTEMKLEGAGLSLLSGSGSVKGFWVGNPEGYKTPAAIKVGSASLGVKPRSIFSDKVHVTHVRVEAPEITFEGKGIKENNLSKILENVEAATGGPGADKPKEEPKGASKKLQVDEFTITGGKIQLSATLLGGKAVTLPLPDIQFKDLGQGPEGITVAELTKKVLSEVTANTLKAVQKSLSEVGAGAVDAAKGAAKDAAAKGVQDATKSIGDLFKKK